MAEEGAIRLSPLNFRGIIHREFDYSPSAAEFVAKKRLRAEWVSGYRCPECGEFYGFEEDAEECCQGPDEDEEENLALLCPVCGSKNESATVASDCCLWKDIDQATRHAIAHRVNSGSTWAEELGIWPPIHRGTK